jgi:RHS repeat-associated protein
MRGCEVPNTPGQSQPTPTQGDAIIFYSAHGLKLGVYCLKDVGGTRFQIASEQNLYFRGRFVARVGLLRNLVSIGTDRLLSTQSQGGHFPYGEFKNGSATAQDKEEFATYTRDRSGLDYADQRIYASGLGRFSTTDPKKSSAKLVNPGTQNRYLYITSDPVNNIDPSGLDACAESPATCIEVNEKYLDGDRNIDCNIIPWHSSCGGGGGGGRPEPVEPEDGPTNDSDEQADEKPKIVVTNLTKRGTLATRLWNITSQIKAAFEQGIDDDCKNWLNGSIGILADLLGTTGTSEGAYMAVGNVSIPSVNAFTGNLGAVGIPEGYSALTVNANGAFFSNSQSTANGQIQGGTALAGTFIILHELGHLTDAAGFQSDFGNEEAGRSNNNKVLENCKTLLEWAK